MFMNDLAFTLYFQLLEMTENFNKYMILYKMGGGAFDDPQIMRKA